MFHLHNSTLHIATSTSRFFPIKLSASDPEIQHITSTQNRSGQHPAAERLCQICLSRVQPDLSLIFYFCKSRSHPVSLLYHFYFCFAAIQGIVSHAFYVLLNLLFLRAAELQDLLESFLVPKPRGSEIQRATARSTGELSGQNAKYPIR